MVRTLTVELIKFKSWIRLVVLQPIEPLRTLEMPLRAFKLPSLANILQTFPEIGFTQKTPSLSPASWSWQKGVGLEDVKIYWSWIDWLLPQPKDELLHFFIGIYA